VDLFALVLAFLPDHPKKVLWSGGRDLNLRQSGFCTLDRLNDAHHTGRRLQRLRQPRHTLGWLGSSTKLSYLPTDFYNVKITIYAFRYASTNCHNYLRFLEDLSAFVVFFSVVFKTIFQKFTGFLDGLANLYVVFIVFRGALSFM